MAERTPPKGNACQGACRHQCQAPSQPPCTGSPPAGTVQGEHPRRLYMGLPQVADILPGCPAKNPSGAIPTRGRQPQMGCLDQPLGQRLTTNCNRWGDSYPAPALPDQVRQSMKLKQGSNQYTKQGPNNVRSLSAELARLNRTTWRSPRSAGAEAEAGHQQVHHARPGRRG